MEHILSTVYSLKFRMFDSIILRWHNLNRLAYPTPASSGELKLLVRISGLDLSFLQQCMGTPELLVSIPYDPIMWEVLAVLA
jgi:hypothetical protein